MDNMMEEVDEKMSSVGFTYSDIHDLVYGK